MINLNGSMVISNMGNAYEAVNMNTKSVLNALLTINGHVQSKMAGNSPQLDILKKRAEFLAHYSIDPGSLLAKIGSLPSQPQLKFIPEFSQSELDESLEFAIACIATRKQRESDIRRIISVATGLPQSSIDFAPFKSISIYSTRLWDQCWLWGVLGANAFSIVGYPAITTKLAVICNLLGGLISGFTFEETIKTALVELIKLNRELAASLEGLPEKYLAKPDRKYLLSCLMNHCSSCLIPLNELWRDDKTAAARYLAACNRRGQFVCDYLMSRIPTSCIETNIAGIWTTLQACVGDVVQYRYQEESGSKFGWSHYETTGRMYTFLMDEKFVIFELPVTERFSITNPGITVIERLNKYYDKNHLRLSYVLEHGDDESEVTEELRYE